MDVEEALSGPAAASGSVVTVTGLLLATNRAAHLAPDDASADDVSRSILVRTDLVEGLARVAPTLVGGRAFLADPAEVRGALSAAPSGGYAAVLSDVEEVALLRRHATFRALAGGGRVHREAARAPSRVVALPEVLADPASFVGRPARIGGFLVTTEEGAHLAPGGDGVEDLGRSIVIPDPRSLDDRLAGAIACNARPPHLHLRPAEVEGVVRPSGIEPFPVALTDLTSVVFVERAGAALLVTEVGLGPDP